MTAPRFVEVGPDAVRDASELVGRVLGSGTGALLLAVGALPPAFFELRTGFAGELVQKLVNYQIRTAAVVPDLGAYSERFREFAREANAGRQLRFFATRAEAVDWLEGP